MLMSFLTKIEVQQCVCICARLCVYYHVFLIHISSFNRDDMIWKQNCHVMFYEFLISQRKKTQKLFDPCASLSSCCVRTLIRSLKLKRPKNGRCDQTHMLFLCLVWISSVCVIMFPVSLRVFPHHCFIIPPNLLCGCFCLICLLTSDSPNTPMNTFQIFLRFFKEQKIYGLLIWLIINWMTSNRQLILSGLPGSWPLLLQNVNAWPSVAPQTGPPQYLEVMHRSCTMLADCQRTAGSLEL